MKPRFERPASAPAKQIRSLAFAFAVGFAVAAAAPALAPAAELTYAKDGSGV